MSTIGKEQYPLHSKKRKIRKILINTNKGILYTTGGPEITNAHSESLELGFTKMISYENDFKRYEKQVRETYRIKGMESLSVCYGDILKASVNDYSFYDLDFCDTIYKHRDHIVRFCNRDFLLTVCTRDGGGRNIKDCLIFFMKTMNFTEYTIIQPDIHTYVIKTHHTYKTFLCKTYADGAPMISITNLN